MNNYITTVDASVSTLEKVNFLKDKANYHDNPTKVEAFETHMSWVFLTDHLVYKLKKPVRFDALDFSTLELREKNSREEVRLNKRLARNIYLGVVCLTIDRTGKLQLDGKEKVVDWLVKMKRLPKEYMLDYTIKHKTTHHYPIHKAATILAEFYRDSPPVRIDPIQYRNRLEQELIAIEKELLSPDYNLPADLIKEIVAGQSAFVFKHSALLDQRVKENRIIEAHGDLRPEHICLINPPVLIDCLEFSKEQRLLDVAEELSFLAVECEILGTPEIGALFFRTYQRITGDRIPDILIHFFKSKRACYKARFTIWHIKEIKYRDDPKWAARAQAYLELAKKYTNQLK